MGEGRQAPLTSSSVEKKPELRVGRSSMPSSRLGGLPMPLATTAPPLPSAASSCSPSGRPPAPQPSAAAASRPTGALCGVRVGCCWCCCATGCDWAGDAHILDIVALEPLPAAPLSAWPLSAGAGVLLPPPAPEPLASEAGPGWAARPGEAAGAALAGRLRRGRLVTPILISRAFSSAARQERWLPSKVCTGSMRPHF